MWCRIKRFTKVLLTALIAFLVIAAPFVWWQRDAMIKEVRAYGASKLRESIANCIHDLKAVDRVVVMRFENQPVHPGQPKYTTAEWGDDLYLAKEVSLTDQGAETLASIWRKLDAVPNKVMCHNPHHAVKFYANGRLLCESIICFHCFNASLPVGPLRALVNFDSSSPEYLNLKAQIESLVGAAN